MTCRWLAGLCVLLVGWYGGVAGEENKVSPKDEMRMPWARVDSTLDARPMQASLSHQDGVLTLETGVVPFSRIGGGEPIRILAVAPAGEVVAQKEARLGDAVTFQTGAWPDGPYEIRVEMTAEEGYRIFRYVPWYKGDWLGQARAILDGCDALPENASQPADLRLRVVGDFVRDGLGGDPRRDTMAATGPDDWRRIHSALMEHREISKGAAPDGFVRLAWVDEVDGSAQFARAYLPPDYADDQAWPMVVRLHGYHPANPEYVRWWGMTNRHSEIAERYGVIFLEPHGRGNTGYNGIGDRDVLRAIREAKKVFRVDEDHVYLTGTSMGGGGTWHVGTRHPELFAAIAPIYGGWDYHVWMDAEHFARLRPRERFMFESESSFAQAEALLNTPVFVNHGDSDALVDADFSRYAVRMLERWRYPIRYWEHPGKGHENLGVDGEITQWFLTYTRMRDPRRVRVRSAYLKSAGAHWVRVTQQEDPFAFIQVDARVLDRHTLRLDTENVAAVQLRPGEALIDHGMPVRVFWNGKEMADCSFADGAIALQAAGYAPALLHKTPEVAGLLSDVTTTPFALVAGTISKDERMRRFCMLQAESARAEWQTWQHAMPHYFLDTEITDEAIRNYSLILFGGPDENLVTRKLMAKLPLVLKKDRVVIDGHAFAVKDASVAVVYPNPMNKERYVAIRAGTTATGMFLVNRLPDAYDFAIADGRATGNEDGVPFEDLCVAAGRFDMNWRCVPAYTITGDSAKRQAAEVRKAPVFLNAAVNAKSLMLSELLETQASGSFSILERDLNWNGKAIALDGKTYDHGIGVAAWQEPCEARYDLSGGNWQYLRATIGIEVDRKPEDLEEKHKEGTRVYFVVRGDGKQLYRSPTFRWDSKPVDMEVAVSGVKTLELEVANEAQWHNVASSVNWANLRLEK